MPRWYQRPLAYFTSLWDRVRDNTIRITRNEARLKDLETKLDAMAGIQLQSFPIQETQGSV